MASSDTDASLKAVSLLLNYAHRELLPALRTDDDPYERAIRVALFSRGVSCAEAAVKLGEAGYGREVMMLNRPLFELMVDAHWTRVDSELARKRFVQHARFTQHLRREAFRRYPEIAAGPVDGERLPAEELDELRRIFGRHGGRGWTGLDLRRRVRAIEGEFGDENGRRQLWLYIELLHPLMNRELHPDSWSLGRGLRRVPSGDEEEILQVRTSPEGELVAEGLKLTWWILGQLLGLMRDDTGLPAEPLLDAGDAGAALLGTTRVAAATA